MLRGAAHSGFPIVHGHDAPQITGGAANRCCCCTTSIGVSLTASTQDDDRVRTASGHPKMQDEGLHRIGKKVTVPNCLG
jgi:hypothetical protein